MKGLLLQENCQSYFEWLNVQKNLRLLGDEQFEILSREIDSLLEISKKNPVDILEICDFLLKIKNLDDPFSFSCFLFFNTNSTDEKKEDYANYFGHFIVQCLNDYADNATQEHEKMFIALLLELAKKFPIQFNDETVKNLIIYLQNRLAKAVKFEETDLFYRGLLRRIKGIRGLIQETWHLSIFQEPGFLAFLMKNLDDSISTLDLFKLLDKENIPIPNYPVPDILTLSWVLNVLQKYRLLNTENFIALYNNIKNISIIRDSILDLEKFKLLTPDLLKGLIQNENPNRYTNQFIDTLASPLAATLQEFKEVRTLQNESHQFGLVNFSGDIDRLLHYYSKKYETTIYKSTSDDEQKKYILSEIRLQYQNEDNIRIPIVCGLQSGTYARGMHMQTLFYIKENGKEALYYSDSAGVDKDDIRFLADTNLDVFYVKDARQASTKGCLDDAVAAIKWVCRKENEEYTLSHFLDFLYAHSTRDDESDAQFCRLTKLPKQLLQTCQISSYYSRYLPEEEIDITQEKKFKHTKECLYENKEGELTQKKLNTYLYYHSIKSAQIISIQKKIQNLPAKLQENFWEEYKKNNAFFIKNFPGEMISETHFEKEVDDMLASFLRKNKI